MPLRIDPPAPHVPIITPRDDQRCVVSAPGRLHRPRTISTEGVNVVGRCPFCEGHEADTPAETWADRTTGHANGAGWRVRVVPNLFPILEENPNDPANSGRHEVIIERPDHAADWRGLSADHLTAIFRSYRDRLRSMAEESSIAASVLFKNAGLLAGASQYHAHAQLIGLPIVPPMLTQMFRTPTPTNEILSHRREHLVYMDDQIVIFCPPASLFPLEVWIGPRVPERFFIETQDHILSRLARATGSLLDLLAEMIEPLDFHFFLHSPGPRDAHAAVDRWMLKITPRLENLGGLEWASNVFINPLPADWSAQQYRDRWSLFDG
ncbi:hypothetical protein K2X85_18625 [bacterium]|nr:hypothetical protein [bacterium]